MGGGLMATEVILSVKLGKNEVYPLSIINISVVLCFSSVLKKNSVLLCGSKKLCVTLWFKKDLF